jgi:hypothetical protein
MNNKRGLLTSLGLFGVLVAIYFFTYLGHEVSTDELILFDAGHSVYQNGLLELRYTSDLRPFPVRTDGAVSVPLDSEPLQSYVASVMIWLAAHLHGIGLMQMAWTLNIFMTALTAVVLFQYALTLGYRELTAIGVALLYALATYAWNYSRFFFREPLFTLLFFIAAYSLQRWRQWIEAGKFNTGWLAAAVLALLGALLTKETSLLLIPALLVVAAPKSVRRLLTWKNLLAVTLFVLIFVSGIVLLANYLFGARITAIEGNVMSRLQGVNTNGPYILESLSAYLIAPGYSLWSLSPVLLLGLPGATMLARSRRLRELMVPLVALIALVVGYSLIQGVNWYGGVGWGARYLLPLTPFMALWLLPVVDYLLGRKLPRWAALVVIGVVVESIFIQFIAVSVPLQTYTDYLSSESAALKRPADTPIVAWKEGIWNPLYLPQVVSAHLANGDHIAVAWDVTGTGLLVVPLCLMVGMLAAGMGYVAHRRGVLSWQGTALRGLVILAAIVVMLYVGLRSYYNDGFYTRDYGPLPRVLDQISVKGQPGDAIILNDSFYRRYFMNYYPGTLPVYTMPDAPGERLGSNTQPAYITDNPEGQASAVSMLMLPRLAVQAPNRWWFVTEFSPYFADRLRPTERFLTRHYFTVDEPLTELDLRLVEYAPISAPPDSVPPWPATSINADFGAAVLVGCDLPQQTVRAGNILPVSLLWRHDSWPADVVPFDYSVNVSLVNAEGAVVAQRAAPPLDGFIKMTQWVKGSYYRDNDGLELKPDLPPGVYEIWVVVYNWSDNSKLRVRNTADGVPADHVVIGKITVISAPAR